MTAHDNAARDYPRIVTPPPGPIGRDIIARDEAHSSTSYIKEYPLVVGHGRGAMIEDVDGNRYIDFMAGIAAASTGHAHPHVVKAIQDAAEKFLHICGTDFYYPGFADLCARLSALGPGPGPWRVFLSNSGSEAVDGAIKLVRNSTGRGDLIAFRGAFHGRTYGAVSLTCSKVHYRKGFGPMLPGIHHVPYPDPYRLNTGGRDAGDWVLDHIRAELFGRKVAPTDVAAIFIEPMLGEGGYVIPPAGFMRGLRELCDEHGILLVCDEIQSGAGRTGKMWAVEHEGVEPDVVLTAKGIGSGMPIGAIIAREEIMRWGTGSHGSTYGGNPVCCAAALATLDLLQGGLLDNARDVGEHMRAGLRKLQDKHACIGDVRGVGLFVGVEFVKDRTTKAPAKELIGELEKLAFARGLLLLPCGQSVLRIAPPLVIDKHDVDVGLRILDACLSELTA